MAFDWRDDEDEAALIRRVVRAPDEERGRLMDDLSDGLETSWNLALDALRALDGNWVIVPASKEKPGDAAPT